MTRSFIVLLFSGILVSLGSCESKFDEYYDTSAAANGNIYEQLSSNPEYSEFTEILHKTGYDSALVKNQMYTVFAPKNGAFAGIDMNNIDQLKKIAGMHIVPSAVYQSQMDSCRIKALGGKYLTIYRVNSDYFVNGISISKFNMKVGNGVIHQIELAITPKPNLYEAIATDPDCSMFYNFINQANAKVFDVVHSKKVGVDSLTAKTVYDSVFVIQNYYLNSTRLNDESVVSTLFVPINAVVSKLLSTSFLVAKGNVPTKNDTLNFYNRLFTYVVSSGKIYNLTRLQSLISVPTVLSSAYPVSATFPVDTAKFAKPEQTASNGVYYKLKDLTPIEYLFQLNYTLTAKTIDASNRVTLQGATTITSRALTVSNTYSGTVMKLNFAAANNGAMFKFTNVTPGYYKVILNVYSETNSGKFNVLYNNQVITSASINTSDLQPTTKQNMYAGQIHVNTYGDVQLQFICTGSGRSSKFELNIDQLGLIPTTAP